MDRDDKLGGLPAFRLDRSGIVVRCSAFIFIWPALMIYGAVADDAVIEAV